MTQIVLAVPERALAVFPGFAPMDGRESDDERVGRDTDSRDSRDSRDRDSGEIPRGAIEDAAPLNQVPIGRVVPNARRLAEIFDRRPQPGDPERACDDVRLCWMKVATGRIDAKRPAPVVEDLPGREPQ